MRKLAAAVLVATTIAGCGASDEDKVRDTADSFLEAYADGDGEAACAQLSDSGRELAQEVAGQSAEEILRGEDEPAASCEEALAGPAGGDPPAIENVDVDGPRATVVLDGGRLTLSEQDGDWAVDELTLD